MQRQGEVHVHVLCSRIDVSPSDPSPIVYHSSLLYITHVPLQWAMTDPANGHKFISSEPRGGKKEGHKKERKTGRNKVALCSTGEGDGPWLILKTLYYLFKKP